MHYRADESSMSAFVQAKTIRHPTFREKRVADIQMLFPHYITSLK